MQFLLIEMPRDMRVVDFPISPADGAKVLLSVQLSSTTPSILERCANCDTSVPVAKDSSAKTSTNGWTERSNKGRIV